jgi:hypothetical protein
VVPLIDHLYLGNTQHEMAIYLGNTQHEMAKDLPALFVLEKINRDLNLKWMGMKSSGERLGVARLWHRHGRDRDAQLKTVMVSPIYKEL